MGEGELCSGAGVWGDPRLGVGVGFGLRIAGAGYDVDDGGLADDEVKGFVVDLGGEAFGCLLDGDAGRLLGVCGGEGDEVEDAVEDQQGLFGETHD